MSRIDLAQFLIKESTGLEVSDFINGFKKLPANAKNKLITDENISDALRILNTSKNKFDNVLKIYNDPDQRLNRMAIKQFYSDNTGLKNYTDNLIIISSGIFPSISTTISFPSILTPQIQASEGT